MADYEKLSLVELRLAAKKLGIKNVTIYKKKELLEKVLEVSGEQEEKSTENKAEEQKSAKEQVKAEKKEQTQEETKENNKKQEARDEVREDTRPQGRNYGYAGRERRTDNTYQYQRRSYDNRNETRYSYAGRNYNRQNDNGGYSRQNDNNGYGRQSDNGGYTRQIDNNGYNRQNDNGGYSRQSDNNSYVRTNDNGGYSRQTETADNSDNRTNVGYTGDIEQLDSGEVKEGILEVMSEGFGFIRCDNYLPGEEDIYVSPALIRKYHLRTGDILKGNIRIRNQNEKFGALLYIKSVNGVTPEEIIKRVKFEQLTPVFPDERIRLETQGGSISMRMLDLISPIGKGQRGMIVSQPKTGKTTLLKQVAKAVKTNYPKMHIIVLLIDERPEEVTDIKESIIGHNVEVIYSTFDELPENHKRVSEMVIERAKRLVEHGEDVMILLDSITRLARAYNLTVQPSGRTLSGGLDPAALHMPKRFFGAARNMREGGSLTILATALVDTGSKMDDVVFEEFKGTGNMEIVLDRKLSEKRVFPAIDLPKSSTRRDDLLLRQDELEATFLMRKAFGGVKSDEAVERIIDMFRRTKNNFEFIETIKKTKIV